MGATPKGVEIEIGGRSVTVLPFLFFDLPRVTELVHKTERVVLPGPEELNALAELFGKCIQGKSGRMTLEEFKSEFAEIDTVDLAAFSQAMQKANSDFFNPTPTSEAEKVKSFPKRK